MDRQDVEKTVTEYLKPIFGFALKRCKSVQDAEDLSQEIAAKAFRALLVKDDVADMGKLSLFVFIRDSLLSSFLKWVQGFCPPKLSKAGRRLLCGRRTAEGDAGSLQRREKEAVIPAPFLS